MELSTYLTFNGDCAAAFRFYEELLGGRIEMMQTHGESPIKDQVAAGWHDKVLHARLVLDKQALMGSDAPPGHYAAPQGIHVSLALSDVTRGERIFNSLAEGGTVSMAFQKTFWAAGFGMVTDRFGIPWMVNVE